MRQLVGKKKLNDKERKYFITGDRRRGYTVEVCETTCVRKSEPLFPGGADGWRKAKAFASRMRDEVVEAEHLKGIAEDFINNHYSFDNDTN